MAVKTEAHRDEQGYLSEFEQPTRKLSLQTLRKSFLPQTPQVVFDVDADDKEISRVDWGQAFDLLPGTFVDPGEFVDFFEVGGAVRGRMESLLLSEISASRPMVCMNRGNFFLNIYNGSRCLQARVLSALGSTGNFSDGVREEYQQNFYQLIRPIFNRNTQIITRWNQQVGDRRPILVENDDVGASIVTLGSSGHIIDEVVGLNHFSWRQLNLAEATAHSIAMAALDAERLGIRTEMNVGCVAWGLTEGLGPKGEHKNYIATVPGLDGIEGVNIFKVGDVGDAAKRIRGSCLPWEHLRQDDYYSREEVRHFTWTDINASNELRLSYAMGGLMVEGMLQATGIPTPSSVIMARASRQNGEDGSFYAQFSDLVAPLQAWKAKVLR